MKNLEVDFRKFFLSAKKEIVVLGTTSLIPFLEHSATFFADLLTTQPKLRLTIIYESDSEIFNQSLCVDTNSSTNRMSYSAMKVHRNRISGTRKGGGLSREIQEAVKNDELRSDVAKRVRLKQANLRMPVNIISSDGSIFYCFVANYLPQVDSYLAVEAGDRLWGTLSDFLQFYLDDRRGGIYLSEPEEELIQLYDKEAFPRGIFPRACFYTTEFQRYSIWGFIFNRKGQLLLHQRSLTTKDGRGLWDKSVGGHVDLRDSSTFITAQRELVEELFLPEAEFSKYIRADLGDIINFGDWNPGKRPERVFKGAFAGLEEADWIQFRATSEDGDPLTITRVSNRRMHDKDGKVYHKRTVFRSDVYLFIAPPDYLDTEEQMRRLLGIAEQKGAGSGHKLVTIGEFRQWVTDAEHEGRAEEVFTDDLLFANLHHRSLLEQFSEFVTFVF